MSRCEKHDLEIGSCADCRPRPGQDQATAAPPRYPVICPVCGERREGGCHPCPGPKVSWTGIRELRDVELVSWGLDPAHPGYGNLTEPATRRSP